MAAAPDPAELDKLICNLEYENQQYLKIIEKEEELADDLRKGISEFRAETERLKDETSHMDEDTKRYHRQFTQNRDNIDSLKKTAVLLREHEDALEQKLRAKQVEWEADKKEREAVLAKYESTFTRFVSKYERFPIYQTLEARRAELEAAEEKVRHTQEQLDEARQRLAKRQNNRTEIENSSLFMDLKTFCIHIATEYVKAVKGKKVLSELHNKIEVLENQLRQRREMEEEKKRKAEEDRVRKAEEERREEERRRQEEDRRRAEEERKREEEERKRVEEENRLEKERRRWEEERRLEDERRKVEEEERLAEERKRWEVERRKEDEERRREDERRQEKQKQELMRMYQGQGGPVVQQHTQHLAVSRIPQPGPALAASLGGPRSPAVLEQPQHRGASPSRIPQRRSPPKLFMPTSPYIPKRPSSGDDAQRKLSQLPVPQALSPAPRPLVAAASPVGRRSEVREHTFSPPLPPDQARASRKYRSSPPKSVQQRSSPQLPLQQQQRSSPPKRIQQRHSPPKLMQQRHSPPKLMQHRSSQELSPVVVPHKQAKRHSPPKLPQYHSPQVAQQERHSTQVLRSPAVGERDVFQARLAAMSIHSPAPDSTMAGQNAGTGEPPIDDQQPVTPGREDRGPDGEPGGSPTSNPKTPEGQGTESLGDGTSPFDYEKHLAKKNTLFNKSPGFSYPSRSMLAGDQSPAREEGESEPMQMDNSSFFQSFLGGGGDAGMMTDAGYSAKSLFGSNEPSGDSGYSAKSLFGSNKPSEPEEGSPMGFNFGPAGDAASPPGASPFKFGPTGTPSPPTPSFLSMFGSGGGNKGGSASPGDGFTLNFGGDVDYSDVQSPKGFNLF